MTELPLPPPGLPAPFVNQGIPIRDAALEPLPPAAPRVREHVFNTLAEVPESVVGQPVTVKGIPVGIVTKIQRRPPLTFVYFEVLALHEAAFDALAQEAPFEFSIGAP